MNGVLTLAIAAPGPVPVTSTDLATWQPMASSIHGAPTADLGGAPYILETGGPLVQVIVRSAVSPGARRFLRVKVEP